MSGIFTKILNRLQNGELILNLSADTVVSDGSTLGIGRTETLHNVANPTTLTENQLTASRIVYTNTGANVDMAFQINNIPGKKRYINIVNDSIARLRVQNMNGVIPIGEVTLQPNEDADIIFDGTGAVRKSGSEILTRPNFSFLPTLVSLSGTQPAGVGGNPLVYDEQAGQWWSTPGGMINGVFKMRLQQTQYSTASGVIGVNLGATLPNCQSSFKGVCNLTALPNVGASTVAFAVVDSSSRNIRVLKHGSTQGIIFNDLASSELNIEGVFQYKMQGYV